MTTLPESSSKTQQDTQGNLSENPRDQLVQNWCQQHFPEADCKPASSDASFRRYFRLTFKNGDSHILMDAPPEQENSQQAFIQIADLLTQSGLKAPQVLKQDLKQGLLLLSDLGKEDYLSTLKTNTEQAPQYFSAAISALIQWQNASKPNILEAYSDVMLRNEMELFTTWFVQKHCGYTLDDSENEALKTIFQQLIDRAQAQAKCFVHRDFMPRNLMVCPAEVPAQAVGILDFQDAAYGPISYDVVSLFRDAFISWPEEDELDWVVRYWEKARQAKLPVPEDFATFWEDYEWMGLQRHLKVAGIFCRLKYRDGKENYITDLPRFIDYIQHTAKRYILFKPLQRLIEQLADSK